MPRELSITPGPGGRILTNVNVWSPDGQWIAYDTRSDAAGDRFDGSRIEAVNVHTGEIRVLYESRHGAHCGVVTWHPRAMRVAFILGPEHPTPDWTYGPARRQGVMVDFDRPGIATPLDARDLVPPFTPGALRGGSHVHVWHPTANLVSFTYDDHFEGSANRRTIGVCHPDQPVTVPKTHPRNHDGSGYSVVVVRTVAEPQPGSDEISRAFEEAWIGSRRALAFQGHVRTTSGATMSEVFVVDLPRDLTRPAPEPRRLTFTANDPFPGLAGPRHWLRSSPDGSQIGFLKRDNAGIVQFWTVSPDGGPAIQITRNPYPVASCFTWHPDGRRVAFVMDHSLCLTDVATGATVRVTPRTADAPRPEACVVSPDGRRIAFVCRDTANRICIVEIE